MRDEQNTGRVLMSLKDTNATLLNMLTDLEDEKRSSSEESEDTSSESMEKTQMADEKTSHLNVVNPLDNLLDAQAEATVVLGNTKTIFSDEASQEEDVQQEVALKEDNEEYMTSQDQEDQEEAVQESSYPESIAMDIDNKELLSLSSEAVIDEAEESHVVSLQDKTQAEGVITNSILMEDEGGINLGLDTFSKSDENTSSLILSKFMEHAEDSVSQPQATPEVPLIDDISDSSSPDSSSPDLSSSSPEKPSSSKEYFTNTSTIPITPSNSSFVKPSFFDFQELASKKLSDDSSKGDASVGVVLKRADQFRIAQERIHELENTVFNVRQENAEFSSEIETLKKRIEELSSLLESTERRNRTKMEGISDERTLLEESLFQKNKEYNTLKLKVEELKNRLAKDLKSVRVREIELENRLELVKQEKTTLLKSKDEIILSLKRKTDHLIMDIDGYRKKSQLAQIQISENEERVQRSVRALRLALGMLEGNDSQ